MDIQKQKVFDVTLPGEKMGYGRLHPISQAINKLADIFLSMGFEVVEGPELETDYYNFESLNIPFFHPSRDMQDTFYVKVLPVVEQSSLRDFAHLKDRFVMRTHTSNVQVRVMEKRTPPLRICTFGKCFRREATDASHEHTFYQVEGFVVDKDISIANLIYTMKSILSKFFDKEVEIRLRPAYFPFTEPSYEVVFKCLNCHPDLCRDPDFGRDGDKNCPVCKGSGWLEIFGAGMIHPNVLKNVGYQEGQWQGFAFGGGIDRLVMLKYQIDDIRWFHSGDLRFIRQF